MPARRRRAAAAVAALALASLLAVAAAQQCGPGFVQDGACNKCAPGFGGPKCKKCSGKKVAPGNTTAPCTTCNARSKANAAHTACDAAQGVVDDGTFSACLPGYGGPTCKHCTGKKFAPGGSLAKCASCPRGATGNSGNSGCTCSSSLVWNPATNQCASGPAACGSGQELVNGACVAVCAANQIRDASGQCVPGCVVGQELFNGVCVAVCAANHIRDGSGQCVPGCVAGQELFNGVCVAVCAANHIRDGSGQCVPGCVAGQELFNGVCVAVCPANHIRDGSGQCFPGCVAGQELFNSVCVAVCPANQIRNATGQCVPGCVAGHELFNGVCVTVCPANQIRDGSGQCVPGCVAGQELFSGVCVAVCAANEIRNSTGQCIQLVSGKFNIQLVRIGNDTSGDAAFSAAKARWEAVLAAVNVPTFNNPSGEDLSAGWVPGYNNTQAVVDDLLIMYGMATLPNNTLATAGPTYLRGAVDRYIPASAVMVFDKEQINKLGDNGFKIVVLHEMGHSLGLGTIDAMQGCVVGCTPGSGADIRWQCPAANREYTALGCTGKVPIETELGEGSGCSHWSEAKLKDELMTPVLGDIRAPMSRVTVGALEDLYGTGLVDYAVAEPWSCTAGDGVPIAGASAAAAEAAAGGATPASPGVNDYQIISIKPVVYSESPAPGSAAAAAAGGARAGVGPPPGYWAWVEGLDQGYSSPEEMAAAAAAAAAAVGL